MNKTIYIKQAFESYAVLYEYDLSTDSNGDYVSMETYDAYKRFFANELAKEQ